MAIILALANNTLIFTLKMLLFSKVEETYFTDKKSPYIYVFKGDFVTCRFIRREMSF